MDFWCGYNLNFSLFLWIISIKRTHFLRYYRFFFTSVILLLFESQFILGLIRILFCLFICILYQEKMLTLTFYFKKYNLFFEYLLIQVFNVRLNEITDLFEILYVSYSQLYYLLILEKLCFIVDVCLLKVLIKSLLQYLHVICIHIWEMNAVDRDL